MKVSNRMTNKVCRNANVKMRNRDRGREFVKGDLKLNLARNYVRDNHRDEKLTAKFIILS